MLADFARTCRAQDTPVVIMHQDAFAADYQEEEYRLVGMAIKFAGICGKRSPHRWNEQADCRPKPDHSLNAGEQHSPRALATPKVSGQENHRSHCDWPRDCVMPKKVHSMTGPGQALKPLGDRVTPSLWPLSLQIRLFHPPAVLAPEAKASDLYRERAV